MDDLTNQLQMNLDFNNNQLTDDQLQSVSTNLNNFQNYDTQLQSNSTNKQGFIDYNTNNMNSVNNNGEQQNELNFELLQKQLGMINDINPDGN